MVVYSFCVFFLPEEGFVSGEGLSRMFLEISRLILEFSIREFSMILELSKIDIFDGVGVFFAAEKIGGFDSERVGVRGSL